MTFIINSLLTIFALVVIIGCDADNTLPTGVVPGGVEIQNYPWAKDELIEQIALCGEGVVEGSTQPNKCSYQIKVDELFLTNPVNKTGLLHKNKLTGEGVQWVMPSAADIAAVPESWDLRSLNPAVAQVKMDRQTCGSCWANSTAKMFDLMVAAYDGKVIDSSEQYLVSTCVPTGDCGGGYMTTPDHLIKNTQLGGGMPLESEDPYKGVNSSCKFTKEQMKVGWQPRIKAAPWVGSSLMHSKGYNKDARGNTAEMIKALMFKYKSAALVTVAAYDVAGDGVVNSCSFGGTNHMVVVVGWSKEAGSEVASVWNSWGKGHGLNGVSRIKWECGGPGKLNRRLGEEARVYLYEAQCANQAEAITGPDQTIIKLNPSVGVMIGKKAKAGQTCKWLPEAGLSDPNDCNPFASPEISTEYHLTAKTECGEATSMVMVNVLGPKMEKGLNTLTPFGIIKE